jgi:RNA polymerase sigma factor (sigma-70 family)
VARFEAYEQVVEWNSLHRSYMDRGVAPSDRQLWADAVAGDADAFGLIFDRHNRAVYNLCFRVTGNWDAAEELMAETFLIAWRKREGVVFERDSVVPWLYGIASNLARNRWRRSARAARAIARLRFEREEPDFAPALISRIEQEHRARKILDLFRQLSRRDQDVIALCDWGGLTYDAAAAVLDIPVGTVRSRLARGRSRLRELASDSGHYTESSNGRR